MRKLILKSGAAPKEYPIGTGITIGRSPNNAIRLEHQDAKESHAKITLVGAHVFIEDLDSRRTLVVNGKQAVRWALKNGDVIALCGMELRYEEDGKPEPSAKPAAPAATAPKPIAAATSRGSGIRTPTNVQAVSAPRMGRPPSGAVAVRPGSGVNLAAKPGTPGNDPSKGLAPATDVLEHAHHPGPAPIQAGSQQKHSSSSQRLPIIPAASAHAALPLASRKGMGTSQRLRQANGAIRAALILGLLLFLGIALLYAVPYFQRWRAGVSAEREAGREEREALQRLRQAGPKDPKDLQIVQDRLRKAKNLNAFTDLLGEPDLQGQDKFQEWNPTSGSVATDAHEYKAYYILDPQYPDPAHNYVAPVLLIKVDAKGACTSKMTYYSRVYLPPQVTSNRDLPAGSLPQPGATSPATSPKPPDSGGKTLAASQGPPNRPVHLRPPADPRANPMEPPPMPAPPGMEGKTKEYRDTLYPPLEKISK